MSPRDHAALALVQSEGPIHPRVIARELWPGILGDMPARSMLARLARAGLVAVVDRAGGWRADGGRAYKITERGIVALREATEMRL